MVHFLKNSVISTLAKKKSYSDSFSKDLGLSKKSLWFSVIIILFLRSGSLLILQGFLSIFFAIRGDTAPLKVVCVWNYSWYYMCACFSKSIKKRKNIMEKIYRRCKIALGSWLMAWIMPFLTFISLIGVTTIFASRWVLSSESPILYPGLLIAFSLPMWALFMFFYLVVNLGTNRGSHLSRVCINTVS